MDDLIGIQVMKYQYALPNEKYDGETKDATYKIDTEWHTYYSVDVHKNYFIEDELEFLKALKSDLEREFGVLNNSIEEKGKTLQKTN